MIDEPVQANPRRGAKRDGGQDKERGIGCHHQERGWCKIDFSGRGGGII